MLTRRNFDAASEFGIVQLDANVAALGAQLVGQVFSHRDFDVQRAVRKRFVAALGPHGERREFFAANFLPCCAAQGRKILRAVARHHARYRIKRHAEYALDPRHGFLGRCAFAEFNQQPVARPQNALHRQAFQRALQRHVKLAQEETAISALQPDLMIVNDDNEFRSLHRFPRGRSNPLIIAAVRSHCPDWIDSLAMAGGEASQYPARSYAIIPFSSRARNNRESMLDAARDVTYTQHLATVGLNCWSTAD